MQKIDTEDNVLDLDAPKTVAVVEYEDIDPAAWLSGEDALAQDEQHYYILPGDKRIKIAPLTDAEEFRVQKASLRPDPTNNSRKVREFTIYKREFIAASINKAHGYRIGDAGYIEGNALAKRLVGELTNIMTEIMKISGMDTGGSSSGGTGFFA